MIVMTKLKRGFYCDGVPRWKTSSLFYLQGFSDNALMWCIDSNAILLKHSTICMCVTSDVKNRKKRKNEHPVWKWVARNYFFPAIAIRIILVNSIGAKKKTLFCVNLNSVFTPFSVI